MVFADFAREERAVGGAQPHDTSGGGVAMHYRKSTGMAR